ncbi:sialidase family protein [Paenibacillus koleovorans]|uniref:sialidase family protein n=1 Tax=Paenibacillus koleovorans TaxID=121608 RepID=UPI000FDC6DA9|nr:sialidase family protein [Paenibacillus koleovorans]
MYMWQKPNREMANYVLWSEDDGLTWSDPRKIDDIGGEPERIHQLANGDLVYTLVQSADRTDNRAHIGNMLGTLEPVGYYMCYLMASTDGGKSFHLRSVLANNQLYADGEVGIVEYAPGQLLSVSRCGDMGGMYGQPSMIRRSLDFGFTWSEPVLSPYYGQRAIPGKLQSGNILITYRSAPGTYASYAAVFNPYEDIRYEPNSNIWDESRCWIEDGTMVLRTDEHYENGVNFIFYPAEDLHARVEIEAELAVQEADINGCNISAGCWIRFEPNRISLADRPEDSFELDATQFHRYRILREDGTISIFVDGELRLSRMVNGLDVRFVRIGNREGFKRNRSVSRWKSVRVKVENQDDACIDWAWSVEQGYPDQFRRDRILCLDKDGSLMHGNLLKHIEIS